MSDGQPTYYCNSFDDYSGSGTRGDGTGSTSETNDIQWTINAACHAWQAHNITVYAIGFGPNVNQTLMENIGVNCGHGAYYYGNVSQIVNIYNQVAQAIISASYLEQTIVGQGVATSRLYPDSYIRFNYNRTLPYGLIITSETPAFGNNFSQGSFFVPEDSIPYEVRAVSYSGSKWTSRVEINSSSTSGWDSIFDLAKYNSSFSSLGDPYVVNIPIEKVSSGNNNVKISVGLNFLNYSAGSPYNKVIYSLVKEMSSYSPIVSSSEGCAWLLEFEDGSNSLLSVPANYSGSNQCFFTSSNITYNSNDAIQASIYLLLSKLDLNSNHKIENRFSQEDLTINSVEVTGIPFPWETELQIRTWR
jgi:hypothetical protein